jgi:hypothetical protein
LNLKYHPKIFRATKQNLIFLILCNTKHKRTSRYFFAVKVDLVFRRDKCCAGKKEKWLSLHPLSSTCEKTVKEVFFLFGDSKNETNCLVPVLEVNKGAIIPNSLCKESQKTLVLVHSPFSRHVFDSFVT